MGSWWTNKSSPKSSYAYTGVACNLGSPKCSETFLEVCEGNLEIREAFLELCTRRRSRELFSGSSFDPVTSNLCFSYKTEVLVPDSSDRFWSLIGITKEQKKDLISFLRHDTLYIRRYKLRANATGTNQPRGWTYFVILGSRVLVPHTKIDFAPIEPSFFLKVVFCYDWCYYKIISDESNVGLLMLILKQGSSDKNVYLKWLFKHYFLRKAQKKINSLIFGGEDIV